MVRDGQHFFGKFDARSKQTVRMFDRFEKRVSIVVIDQSKLGNIEEPLEFREFALGQLLVDDDMLSHYLIA